MMHRVRLALHNKDFVKIGGSGKEVEVDETFIGGAARFMHADKRREKITDRGVKGKAAIMGILERGGKIQANVIATRKKKDLQPNIRAHVKAQSAIYTDALMSYIGLNRDYLHKTIDHAERYVDGQVHTNGLENFWSLLKRGLKGTYVNVEPFHLFRYLDEQVFRYNNRATKQHFISDSNRFEMAFPQIADKRLTYDEVIGRRAEQPSIDAHSLSSPQSREKSRSLVVFFSRL